MPLKQKANHNLNQERGNIAIKSRETLKEKIVLNNEKEVNGLIVELQSFQGLAEFKIQHRKEKVPFYKNRVLVNGKKLDRRANLMNIMEVGEKVRLKVKPLNKTGSDQHFKILEIEHKDKKLEHNRASTSHSFSTQSNACTAAHTTHFNQVSSQCAPWKNTVSKLPYINGAVGTVVNILSNTTGIVLTDPDDDGGCKVSFEINNLFINGEECKAKSLSMCLHLGQSVYCTATRANEKDDIEYKAFAVWIGKIPLFATMLSSYMPKMKINNLTKGTVCHGIVKLLAPPKAAILALDPDNYAVMFLTYLRNIKRDAYGWIGDYVQVGDTVLVKISGHFQFLCFAVSKAWKVNDTYCKEAIEMLGQSAEVSSGSIIDSCISLNKSYQDTVRSKEVGWMQNESYSIVESAENNKKSLGNNGASLLYEESQSQKMKKTFLFGRTGKVVSYSSKSRGLLLDCKLGYVKFNKTAVVFPAELEHMGLREYMPIGTTVYYNSLLLEKSQSYICTKIWIGKKDKQTTFQSGCPVMLKCPSTLLTEGDSYKAVVFELQLPYGLIVTVETVDKEVLVYVPLRILQLYPDGPFIGRKCPAYIECGAALFVSVHYNYHTSEKRLNWVASKAWISTSCADFEGQDAVAVKTKRDFVSTMSGKLALVTSNRGELSREFGMTVFFSNKNAFLFEINLGQMDLQKVFIKGETLNYILPEDSDETHMEASKVWYGTLDDNETVNQRIDALIGYWMKRGLEKPTLRAMIKELKRQHAEQNLQILPKETEFNSMCSGDNKLSSSSKREESASNKETKSDEEELKRQQEEQNLQIALKGTALSNLSNVRSDRDVTALVKETNSLINKTETEMNTKLHSNDTQDLTDTSIMHLESVVSKLPVALNVPFATECGKLQNTISIDFLANREVSTLTVENKHLSALGSLEQKVLHGLLHFLADGVMNPTLLQEVQIWQKLILKHNDDETETLSSYLLKGIGIGFERRPRQLNLVKDNKSSMVNLSEQGEHMETPGTNQYELKKKRNVAFNDSSHKDRSVKYVGSKCVDATDSHSGAAQCLLNKEESNDVSEIPFCDALQSDTEQMNNKIAKKKKYANKEVQTISTGDILYFKIVPDM